MSVAWQFYISTVLVYLGVDVMACWGLNLQFGVAGLVNFAFIIFQAAGAYTAAVLTLGPAKPARRVPAVPRRRPLAFPAAHPGGRGGRRPARGAGGRLRHPAAAQRLRGDGHARGVAHRDQRRHQPGRAW